MGRTLQCDISRKSQSRRHTSTLGNKRRRTPVIPLRKGLCKSQGYLTISGLVATKGSRRSNPRRQPEVNVPYFFLTLSSELSAFAPYSRQSSLRGLTRKNDWCQRISSTHYLIETVLHLQHSKPSMKRTRSLTRFVFFLNVCCFCNERIPNPSSGVTDTLIRAFEAPASSEGGQTSGG